ncbi:MFS transporter [Pseudooceanicola sp.]|uniref:MFS transporter n=1 Tax=Pseudooceanicola sp. TaxID=1914328 RepID=UPI00260AB545|nr:MFS transporter [Pseudooceanicola sp.]MDF1854452.1 MFS transporter [Pseudooceanicola sp.]
MTTTSPIAERSNFVLVLALYGAGLGAAAQYGKASVLFPLLRDAYPQAGAGLGLVVSGIGMLGIVFGLTAGLVVARLGFRRLLLGALVFGAAMSALQSGLPPLPLMIAARIAEGLSHLVIVVAAPTLIAQVSAPRHRAMTLTLWSTFFGVSFAVLAWVGQPFALRHGPGALFLAHAGYLLAMAVILAIGLPRQRHLPAGPRLTPAALMRQHLRIYRSPRIAAPALGWLFYTLGYVALVTVLPDFVAPDQRSLVTGAMPLAGMVVSMTLGVVLVNRFGPVPVVLSGFFLAVPVALALGFSGVNPMLAIALIACLGLVQGASFAAVPQLNRGAEAQAEANGAMAQMGNLGNSLGTPILLAATSAFGLAGLTGFAMLCFAAGGAVHLVLAAARRVAPDTAEG